MQGNVIMKHYSKMIFKLRLLSMSAFMMRKMHIHYDMESVLDQHKCSIFKKEHKNIAFIITTLVKTLCYHFV